MDIKLIDTEKKLFITLSRHNLETLIKMLDLGVGMPVIHRTIQGVRLIVQAEQNADHYKDREPGVGSEDVKV